MFLLAQEPKNKAFSPLNSGTLDAKTDTHGPSSIKSPTQTLQSPAENTNNLVPSSKIISNPFTSFKPPQETFVPTPMSEITYMDVLEIIYEAGN